MEPLEGCLRYFQFFARLWPDKGPNAHEGAGPLHRVGG